MRRLFVLVAACGSGVHGTTNTHDTVLVPEGAFQMGCHQAVDPDCNADS